MSRVTFTQFRNTATTVEDISQHQNYSGYDKASGLFYCDERFFIASRGNDVWHVELFGDDFRGSLQDCEAELWMAALNEKVLESSMV